jgi:ATP-dependent DNA helicase RecQ
MLENHLKQYFGFSDFRSGQREVIEKILEQKDVVALMPTGGGKSLCYQLPAVLMPGLTVVISPLIALMKDQVDSLSARGIAATFINSSLTLQEIESRMEALRQGRYRLLYIAPERLANGNFRSFFSQIEIAFLAVDEAHCVSQWGHDFRPDYLNISECLKDFDKRPPVAAFTATATPEVTEDIIQRLSLSDPQVFVRGFDRPNLKFFVQNNLKPKERYKEVLRLVSSINGAGIVYALTRKETELIADFLMQNGIDAAAYHAGMSAEQRETIQDEFMENRFKVIVATVAFGMGIDKADIRFVIHAGMPKNLEGYYQEAGRAGRDGETSYCVLLHSKKDVVTHNHFFWKDRQEMLRQGRSWEEINELTDIKKNRLECMKDYVLNVQCRRKSILQYFGDPDLHILEANCRGCDICLNWEKKTRKSESVAIVKIKEQKVEREMGGVMLTDTVGQTVALYQQGYSVERIAKARSLGVSTITGHLIRWHLAGGEFDIDSLITPQEEREILQAMAKADNYQRLKSIKQHLPQGIGYEKIKAVFAKIHKVTLE